MEFLSNPFLFFLQNESPGGSIFGILPMFLMMFAVIYFLMIRPQQKREKERQAMLGDIQKNDHVLTSGGIHGTVVNLKDNEVTLRIDEGNNIRVRFSREAIVQVFRDEKPAE